MSSGRLSRSGSGSRPSDVSTINFQKPVYSGTDGFAYPPYSSASSLDLQNDLQASEKQGFVKPPFNGHENHFRRKSFRQRADTTTTNNALEFAEGDEPSQGRRNCLRMLAGSIVLRWILYASSSTLLGAAIKLTEP